jgi:lysophospholipase L1-like esterase
MSLASDLKASVSKFIRNMSDFDSVMSADNLTDVKLQNGGTVPSLRKLFQTLMTPIVQTLAASEINVSLGAVQKKLVDGGTVNFAFVGDSLTYGQDSSATGTSPPINGATQNRSARPYPLAFVNALGLFYNTATINADVRAYPGDSSFNWKVRWQNYPTVDCAIIMYGHNDANAFGDPVGQPKQTVSQYRANITYMIRDYITKGTAVIVLGPPPTDNPTYDKNIRPYAAAAKQIAEALGQVFVDTGELIAWINRKHTTDDVHLIKEAYNEIGAQLASLFFCGGAVKRSVKPGISLFPKDNAFQGGIYVDNSAGPAGGLIQIPQGTTVALSVYADEECVPYIYTANTLVGTNRKLNCYYGVNESGIPQHVFNNLGTPFIQKKVGQTFHKGWRNLLIQNNDTQLAFISHVEFVSADKAITTSYGNYQPATFVGVGAPVIGNANYPFYNLIDHQKRLSGCKIIATLRTDSTKLQGVMFAADKIQDVDSVSKSYIWIYRSGASLVINFTSNGVTVGTDAVFTNVFSASAIQIDRWDIAIDSGGVNVNINRTGVVSRGFTTGQVVDGYPGIMTNGPCLLDVLAFSVADAYNAN